ncbi:MAG: hypothetical protein ABIP48_24470 [Planctomycetota bacterium]
MKAVGFRAEKDSITWAVVDDSTDPHVVEAFDRIRAPDTYNEAERLALFRERLKALIQQQSPSVAAIRYPETVTRRSATSSDHMRLRIEGVILEAAQSEGINVMTGALRTIGARLGTKTAKTYLDRDDLRGMKYPRKSKIVKDAVIVAEAALGVQHGTSR